MKSNIRVGGGGGSKIAPQIGRYRVGLGRSKMTKKHGTSLMDVLFVFFTHFLKTISLCSKRFFEKILS